MQHPFHGSEAAGVPEKVHTFKEVSMVGGLTQLAEECGCYNVALQLTGTMTAYSASGRFYKDNIEETVRRIAVEAPEKQLGPFEYRVVHEEAKGDEGDDSSSEDLDYEPRGEVLLENMKAKYDTLLVSQKEYQRSWETYIEHLQKRA